MFSGLFARPNPRVAALEAARKLHIAQINGYAGDNTATILSAERQVWQGVLSAFQIDPARGLQANMARLADLLDTCRKLSDRFDFSGLVVPTLLHNSGFSADEADALQDFLAASGVPGKAARRAPVVADQAARPVAAFAV